SGHGSIQPRAPKSDKGTIARAAGSPLPACGERSASAARRVRGTFSIRGANFVKTTLARKLRLNSTDAERKLWRRLRSRAITGCKFVRQELIGPFIVDFVCRERRLIPPLPASGERWS